MSLSFRLIEGQALDGAEGEFHFDERFGSTGSRSRSSLDFEKLTKMLAELKQDLNYAELKS